MTEKKEPRFQVCFWGVRGSYPTPGPHTIRHGGNTACVEVQAGSHTLIFDAGSGIIRLGEALMAHTQDQKRLELVLFLTHGHADHLQGFPFFAPLFYPHTELYVFGPQLAGRNVEELVTPLMSPPYFPVDVRHLPSRHIFHTLMQEQCILWLPNEKKPLIYPGRIQTDQLDPETVCITTWFARCHPQNGTVVYRIDYGGRCLVYATDVEWLDGCDQPFIDLIKGADVLIHDAQYTVPDYQTVKQGYGHSTIMMATEAALAGNVGELILFHHEPTYDDALLDTMETEARARFRRTRSAYEGLKIDLLA